MTAPLVRILGLLGAAMLLASCSGPFFSKVEVKASPTVYAALGNAKAKISDYMSVSKVRDMLKGSADVKVYDYQDSSTVQKFLIHYPLTSIQLDFGQYLKDINLEGQLGQTLTPMSFPIPTVNQTSNSSASFNVNSTLQSTVNSGFGTSTTPFVETGLGGSNTATLPDVAITVGSFSSATFSAGSLNLALSMAAGASSDLTLTATIALINSADSSVITSTGTPVDIKAGGTAVLPLAGKTLPSSFKVRFTATTSGGVSFKNDTVNVTPSLSSDVAISDASGVSFTTTVNVPTITVPMSANSTFVKAQITTGKLAIDLGALPAGWTGFSRSTTLTLSQTGGLNLTPAAITTQTVDLDLANQIIGSADMTISASTTITASNASFSGLSGPTSIAFSSAFTVDKFNYVVVKPGSSFTPTQNFSQATSQQMKDWVNFVDFTSVGIKVDFTNNLPTGNDMTINASSTAFGIPAGTPKVLNSNTSTSVSFLNTSLHFIPANVSTLDFAVTLQPQTYNSTTGELTLNNIVPGSTLTFSGTVSLVNVWSQANIKPPAGGYSGKFPDTGTTDLSALADYLGPGLSFGSISSYLYVSGLDKNAVTNLTGLVQATYTEASVAKTFDVLGTTGTPTAISMLAAPPALTTKADGETIDAVANPLLTGASDVSATLGDLATPLNAKPKDFALTYKLDMDGLTIVQADTVSGSVPKKLLAELIMVLPVQLIASGGAAELKVGNALPTTDLFGRTAGGDNSNINNLLDKLVSMNLNLSIDNKTGMGGNAVLTDGGTFSKSLNLKTGASSPSLTLTSADIKKIRDTIPFVLKLNVTVLDGIYSMERGGSINATITVNAVTDIDQTFNLRGTN